MVTTSGYVRPKEIAAYFGVTLTTVRRWVKAGKLMAIQTTIMYTTNTRYLIHSLPFRYAGG